ncbi:MAG: hypothetical protein H6741_09190 [Alphaproteobacteria bacterium]|nr:hypothetical protein [Alphaproteobacteria bacterium]MCB9792888.1 hypothetical protein [Alphaproteobacteria bacterium]
MILLVSEGPRDHGDEQPYADEDGEGPLRPIIRALLNDPDGLVMYSRSLGKLHGKRRSGRDHLPSERGLKAKVERVLRDLKRDGFDGVIIVIDEDGHSASSRSKRMQRLTDGRATNPNARCALGVARPMVESWLLGDPKAWKPAFGAQPGNLPSRPEHETGQKNVSQQKRPYTKQVLEQALREVGHDHMLSGYTRLARHCDVDTLTHSCPDSFAPFAEEVRSHIGPLYGRRP